MSAELTVTSRELGDCFANLKPLFEKGSRQLPIGIFLRNNALIITCVTGCVYQCVIPVENPDRQVGTITVMYTDVLAILPRDEDLSFEFLPVGFKLCGEAFDATFPAGYSEIQIQDFSGFKFMPASSSIFINGLKDLVNCGMDKLFRKSVPIQIYGNVAVLKYPNVWIQTLTSGIDVRAVVEPEHCKLITTFAPTAICSDSPDVLTFANGESFLQVPMKELVDDNNFTDMLKGLSEPITLSLYGYLDQLRNISKIDPRTHCTINLYATGLKTSVTFENAAFSVAVGNVRSEVLKTLSLPIQLWIAYVKLLGGGTAQFLYGGSILCMRTTSVIIVTQSLI